MTPVSLPYVFNLGRIVQYANDVRAGMKISDANYALLSLDNSIDELLNRSIYNSYIKSCRVDAVAFQTAVRGLLASPDKDRVIVESDLWGMHMAFQRFEAAFVAEMNTVSVYLVTKKRGYETAVLIQGAEVCFPDELVAKAPEAVDDIRQAGRCIAFELPTAAAFHLHRANESVLRKYFDAVAPGITRPTTRNMGDYLKILKDKDLGSKKVRAALQSLKDLERNPIVHPEDSLESVDDAVALLGSIHAAVTHMLKAIPDPATTTLSPAVVERLP